MPLRVLGGVEQQSQHRRGQLKPTDSPRCEQGGFRRGAELGEGAVDLPLEGGHERGGLFRWRPRRSLSIEKGPLRIGERLPLGIREEPVQAARGMADVEPHGGSPAGESPEVVERKRSHNPAYFLYGLEQCVSNRL